MCFHSPPRCSAQEWVHFCCCYSYASLGEHSFAMCGSSLWLNLYSFDSLLQSEYKSSDAGYCTTLVHLISRPHSPQFRPTTSVVNKQHQESETWSWRWDKRVGTLTRGSKWVSWGRNQGRLCLVLSLFIISQRKEEHKYNPGFLKKEL